MRASLKTTIAASLAALTLVAGSVSADAKIFPKMGPHHHFGPGFGFGLIGAGIAAAAIASADSCTGYRAIYDANGHYLGQQAINTCQ